MSDYENKEQNEFDPAARREELIRRFSTLPADQARGQLALLPYYHQLENEITKPNQGTFVTRYFQTKWRTALGSEAASIVLALRLLANNEGVTFASQELIADTAGVSLRALQRWLSDNEKAVQSQSEAWRAQWRFLHGYFLKSKSSRYLIRREGAQSRAKRTTSLYQVAMDDPVHPDDEGALFVKAAERIIQDEAALRAKPLENNENPYSRQIGGNKKKVVLFEGDDPTGDVDNSAYSRQIGGHEAPPDWRNRSLVDRSNVINVKPIRPSNPTDSTFRADPRVNGLSRDQQGRREALAVEIGSWLHRKAGKDEREPHQSAGLHRRIAFFMPEHLIRQVMRDLDDRLADAREGRKGTVRNLSGLFYGFVRRVAEQNGINLEPQAQDPAAVK